MRRSLKRFSVTLMVLFFVGVAEAREALNFNIHQQYISPRAAGMGNAFSAVADSYDALLYNPAGLARLKEGEVHLFTKFAFDPSVLDFMGDISDASDQTDSEQAVADVIESNYGSTYSLRAPSLGGIYARPNWGIAFIPADVTLDLGLNQLTGPAINLFAVQDTTMAFGLAREIPVGSHALALGVTAKGIYRVNVDKLITALDVAVESDIVDVDQAREGLTLDFDVGVLFTPEIQGAFWEFAKPTFSLVVRNLLDYGYLSNFNLFSDETSDDPEKLGRRLDLGAALKLPDWWVWSTQLAMELKNIGHEFYSFEKGFHMGAEFNWKLASWFQGGWRVGMAQGFGGEYLTAGFTGRFAVFHMDLATYADEYGAGSATKPGRKYLLSLATTW